MLTVGFTGGSEGKESACNAGDLELIPFGLEDLLEEGMATHSSILAWRIPWTEGTGGLQSMGSQRVGHDWATKHSMPSVSLIKMTPYQSEVFHTLYFNRWNHWGPTTETNPLREAPCVSGEVILNPRLLPFSFRTFCIVWHQVQHNVWKVFNAVQIKFKSNNFVIMPPFSVLTFEVLLSWRLIQKKNKTEFNVIKRLLNVIKSSSPTNEHSTDN